MTSDDVHGRDTSGPATSAAPSAAGRQRGSAAVPAAAWAFAFLILRVFAVSGYDWDTAFLVSTTIGLDDGLTLVFGSFMAEHLVVELLLVLVLPLLVGTYLWEPDGRRPAVALPTAIGLVMLVALTVSFRNWWLPVTVLAVASLLEAVRRMPSTSSLGRALAAVMTRIGLVAGMAVLVAAVLVQTPWVPRERIVTKEGTITGYVLSVDSGYLNVLTVDQEFVIVLSVDVISRT